MANMNSPFTVSSVAERFGKTTGRIRQICRKYDIGTLVAGRFRILEKRDVDRIEKILRKIGRNRK